MIQKIKKLVFVVSPFEKIFCSIRMLPFKGQQKSNFRAKIGQARLIEFFLGKSC